MKKIIGGDDAGVLLLPSTDEQIDNMFISFVSALKKLELQIFHCPQITRHHFTVRFIRSSKLSDKDHFFMNIPMKITSSDVNIAIEINFLRKYS